MLQVWQSAFTDEMKAYSWVIGLGEFIMSFLCIYYIYYKNIIEDENSKEITLVNKVDDSVKNSSMYKEESIDSKDE